LEPSGFLASSPNCGSRESGGFALMMATPTTCSATPVKAVGSWRVFHE
jgi:hypothetical protein